MHLPTWFRIMELALVKTWDDVPGFDYPGRWNGFRCVTLGMPLDKF